jgi:hypothetical protein
MNTQQNHEGNGSKYRVLVGKPEGRRPLEDSDMDGRAVLKSISQKYNGGVN